VIEDDGEATRETSTSTRATSVGSEMGTVRLHGSCSKELSPTHIYPNAQPLTEPPAKPCDRATSPGVALSQYRRERTVLRDDHAAAAITGGSIQDEEEEWEITNDVGETGAPLLTLIWPS